MRGGGEEAFVEVVAERSEVAEEAESAAALCAGAPAVPMAASTSVEPLACAREAEVAPVGVQALAAERVLSQRVVRLASSSSSVAASTDPLLGLAYGADVVVGSLTVGHLAYDWQRM